MANFTEAFTVIPQIQSEILSEVDELESYITDVTSKLASLTDILPQTQGLNFPTFEIPSVNSFFEIDIPEWSIETAPCDDVSIPTTIIGVMLYTIQSAIESAIVNIVNIPSQFISKFITNMTKIINNIKDFMSTTYEKIGTYLSNMSRNLREYRPIDTKIFNVLMNLDDSFQSLIAKFEELGQKISEFVSDVTEAIRNTTQGIKCLNKTHTWTIKI